jgi:hypothetical protein
MMADRSAEPWYPTAAYLYVLHLDATALAWEYLRRNPDYQRDWFHRNRPEAAHRWGLRLLEDPALDARDAHPAWFPDHAAVLQLHPDTDPLPDSATFEFWRLPGRKSLLHDGKRLILAVRWPGCHLRFALAPGLKDGMAFAFAVRASVSSRASFRAVAAGLDSMAPEATVPPTASARARPEPAELLELHTLQALDATLAGASLRETAVGLFGTEAVAVGWYNDSGLRSRVRRLVRRGQSLMRGGYRRLAQLD